MELLRKFPTIPIISMVRRQIANGNVCDINPVRINVMPNGQRDNTDGESGNSTQRLSLAEEVFGDIGSFLQSNPVEPEVIHMPCIESPNDDIELAITSGAESSILEIETESNPTSNVESPSEHISGAEATSMEIEVLDNNDQDPPERAKSPDIVVQDDELAAQTPKLEVVASNETHCASIQIAYKPSVYLHTHFDMMCICGTCSFRTIIQSSTNVSGFQLPRVISGINMALFVAIVTLSAFHSISDAKYYFLWFLAGGGLNQLVRCAFDFINVISCLYGASILCHKRDDVSSMVQTMNTYEENWAGKKGQPVFSFILAIITIGLAFMKALLVLDFKEMSIQNIMLVSSYELSEDLFLWSSEDLNTTSLQLEHEFGTTLNGVTIPMGIFKIFRNLSFALSQGMLWDIIGNTLLVLFCWMTYFMTMVKAVMENVPEDDQEGVLRLQMMRVRIWEAYRQIRIAFAAVNEVIGPLLMLFHVTNVLRYAFFMECVIFPHGENAFSYMHLLYDIVKSEVVYLTATNIALQNKVIRKWLRNWGLRTGKIDLGYTEMDLTAVLDELDEEPLGLGTGDLMIHRGFHFGILGLVSSLFVMLANKTGAQF